MKEAFYVWDNSVWLSQWNVKKYLDILVREGNNRSKKHSDQVLLSESEFIRTTWRAQVTVQQLSAGEVTPRAIAHFFYGRNLNCGKKGDLVRNPWMSHDSAQSHSLLLLLWQRLELWEAGEPCAELLSVSWLCPSSQPSASSTVEMGWVGNKGTLWAILECLMTLPQPSTQEKMLIGPVSGGVQKAQPNCSVSSRRLLHSQEKTPIFSTHSFWRKQPSNYELPKRW